ncbi:MAG: hypothetical protein QOG67_3219 [Verrucomicrobiota bacterium]|jgi:uncharacterized protein (DUF433 family)
MIPARNVALFQSDPDVSIDSATDVRELPAYGITEATHYLQIPIQALRAWTRAGIARTSASRRRVKPLITLPDRKLRSLSFINLVEAHLLEAIRRGHQLPILHVRLALDYVRKKLELRHPLAQQSFVTEGVKLFLSRLSDRIGASESATVQELIRSHFDRIEHDHAGLAVRLYLFTGKDQKGDQPKMIAIDPYVCFGRPTIRGRGVSTSIIAERYKAGESIEGLADEYGCQQIQVEAAVQCERARSA